MEQEQFVGFDVSQAETSVCVVDGAGKVVWQGKCASTPEAMATVVQRRASCAVRIALETGPMSEVAPVSWTVSGIGRQQLGLHVLLVADGRAVIECGV